MNENIREIVLDILLEHENSNRKSHLLIRDVLDKYDYLNVKDKSFIKRVAEGTISNKITLDYVAERFSKKSVSKLKAPVRGILRESIYQLLFMDKVPDNAVCDEAVKLVKKRSFKEFAPFVNGVLRNIAREKGDILSFSEITDKTKYLSVKYSCPEEIVRIFMKEQDDAEGILKALNGIKTTSVKITEPEKEEDILSKWRDKGIKFTGIPGLESVYSVEDFEGAYGLPGFSEGAVIIQDKASMLAAMAAGVKESDNKTVLDVCAAPGGKSCFIAKTMKNGLVISRDLTDYKVNLIKENAERLHLDNLRAEVHDATVFDESLVNKVDVLICDLPCSGLGVMGRKSDIRYNITNEGMKEICDLQKEILNTVTKYLKKGGVLIYSTCTIHKAENEKVVKYILKNLPFTGDSLVPYIPEAFNNTRESDFYLQLLPNLDDCDGFFISRFIKNE
jgi:16S rRNA (cytosine967-C5)-methyltransferase